MKKYSLTLKSSKLFDSFPAKLKDLIGKKCSIENFKKKDVVFSEGDAAKKMYIIKSGSVRLVQKQINGQDKIVGLYSANDVIALDEFLVQSKKYMFGCIALEATELIAVSLEFYKKNIAASGDLFAECVKGVLAERNVMMQLSNALSVINNVRQKLALFLLYANERVKPTPRKSGPIRLNVSDIDEAVDTTRESGSRVVKVFKDSGIIVKKEFRGGMYIADVKKLKDEAGAR